MSRLADLLDDSAAEEQERQALAAEEQLPAWHEEAEFLPVSRAPEDDGRDLWEGRHRAWQDEAERRYLVSGPNEAEDRDTNGGWW